MTQPREPKHAIRVGAVQAAIWENDGEKGPFHTVTLTRRYKAGENWKRSSSFSSRELFALKTVVNQATAWIRDHESEQ